MLLLQAGGIIAQGTENAKGLVTHLPGAMDLGQKTLEAVAAWLVGFSATQIKARLDDKDRRRQRVQLVTEAADVLRLRDQLRAIEQTAGNWDIVGRLTPHLDEFAQQNLAKVEEQLRAIREGKQSRGSRTLVDRIFLLYPPRQRWLWIHHMLFFASLSSAFTIIAFIFTEMRSDRPALWVSVSGMGFSIAGVVLSACFFNLLGNYNDRKIERECASGGACGVIPARRSWIARALLLFAPRGAAMWTGHLLYLALLGIVLRYLPVAFKDTSGFMIVIWFFMTAFFIGPVLLTFNLLSNFNDMKQGLQEAAAGMHEGAAQPLRRNWFRRAFLLYLPQKWWLAPLHLFFYGSCLFTFLVSIIAISDISGGGGDAVAGVLVELLVLLATGMVALFANLVDGIFRIRKQKRMLLNAIA